MAFNTISKVALAATAFTCITAVPAPQEISEVIDRTLEDINESLADPNSELSKAVGTGVEIVNEFLKCVTQEKCQTDSSLCTECFVNPNPKLSDIQAAENCVTECSKGPYQEYTDCYTGCFNTFVSTGGPAKPTEDDKKEEDKEDGQDHEAGDHDHSSDDKKEEDENVRTDVTRDENGNYVDTDGNVVPTSEDDEGNVVDEEGKIIRTASESDEDTEDPEVNEESSASLVLPFAGAISALLAFM